MEKELQIGKIYGYNSLSVHKARHAAYENQQPDPQDYIVSPTALIGIEVEVENITKYFVPEYYWTAKEDGSLRNHGVEYTSIPLRGHQVPHALTYLQKRMQDVDLKPDYSPRTSIHVHLNVRDMTWNQIKSLVLLYAIFERHFFNIAGTKREQSIFCVPLYKTNQLSSLNTLETSVVHWFKYSAINLATVLGGNDVPKYGTIEFRHLYGTGDKQIILNWINNIMKLREASRVYNYEELRNRIKTMNTSSEYTALYLDVFGEFANIRAMHKQDFEYCISQTKVALFGKTANQNYGTNLTSAYGKYLGFHLKKADNNKPKTLFNTTTWEIANPMPTAVTHYELDF